MPVMDNPRIEELRQRLSRDPASIAFAQLAEEYRRLGDFERAIAVCREGLARHPGYVSARVTLGRALVELERYDEAQSELDAVIRVAPDNLAAIRALAEIHQRRPEFVDVPGLGPASDHEAAPAGMPDVLVGEVSALAPVPPGVDTAVSETAPGTSARVLGELEGWLTAIQRDRARPDA